MSAATAQSAAAGPGGRDLSPWRPSARQLAALVLVPIAVLFVHEARYVLAFGEGANRALSASGHGYYADLLVPISLILAIGLGGYLLRLTQSWRSGESDGRRGWKLPSLWLAATLGLLAIYTGQELLEALLETGAAPSVAIPFGDGGLWAVPVAALAGLLVGLLLNGAVRLVDLVAARGHCRARRPSPRPTIGRPRRARVRPASPMARSGAGRAPPPWPVLTT